MATIGEGPAKKGTKSSLLEELEQAHAEVLSQQASSPKPAEVPPRDQDKDEVAQETTPVPEVPPEVREHEAEVQEEITTRIPDRPDVEVKPPQVLQLTAEEIEEIEAHMTQAKAETVKPKVAEAAATPEAVAPEGEQVGGSLIGKFNAFVAAEHSTKNESPITPAVTKAIPPELEHLSPEERKTYEKIHAEKRESYLAHIAEMRADKEKKERKSNNKKTVNPRLQKPKAQSEPVMPLTPMPPEFRKQRPKPDFIAEQLAAMVAKKQNTEVKPLQIDIDTSGAEVVGKYENLSEAMSNAIMDRYPSGQVVPPEILATYDTLLEKQQNSSKSGATAEQESVVREIKSFIAAQTKATRELESQPTGKPNSDEDEEHPAVWHYSRDRRGNDEAKIEPSPVKWEQVVPPKVEGTPKESREELRKLVEELTRQTNEKRDNLIDAESELLGKDKDFYAKHGIFGRAVREITGIGAEQKSRKDLEGRMDASAVAYEQSLEKKLSARLAQKNLSGEDAAKLAERYRRMVISRDVIDRGEKARESAREAALDSKERTFAERAFRGLAERSAALDKRLGKTGGRIVRVLLSATAGSLATVAFGPASVALMGSIWVTRVARGTVGVFGGAAIGLGAGKIYEKTGGASAARKLAEARTYAARSEEAMAEKRAAYKAGNTEAIARKRKYVEAVAAILSGAGISVATAELAGSGIFHTTSSVSEPQATVGTPPAAAPTVTEAPADVRRVDIGLEKAAGEAPAAGVAAEAAPAAPEIASIEAKAGDSYERMLKHLIDKLPENPPADMKPDSDLAKLFEAKVHPETIGSAIHRLATDNEFYKSNGTNVRIDIGDKMTVTADGNIWVGEDIIAPEGAHMTPAFHPEAPAPHVTAIPAAPAETVVVQSIPPAPATQLPKSDLFFGTPPEGAAHPLTPYEPPPPSAVEAPVHAQPLQVETPPANVASSEIPPSVGEINPHVYVNSLGTSIDPDVTHGYLSGKDFYLFGGDKNLDVLAQNYAQEHHTSVFVDKSFKNWLGWTTDRVVEYVPTDSGPPAMVIHNGPSLVPDPKNFTKLVF